MRLFLAVELPEEIRSRLAEEQARLKPVCRGWRWVRPASIHLTVRFLGEVPESEIAGQLPAWMETAAGCDRGRFDVGGTGVFPVRGRPRVLWAGISGQQPHNFLERIAVEFESTAVSLGFEPDRRRFSPHLTLARATRKGSAEPPPGPEQSSLGKVAVEEVVLFRSELLPDGARYTVLDRFRLGGESA